MDKISVIIPVYGDKRLVKMLYDRLIEVLSKMDVTYEIIMVNDCCPYGSGEEIEKLATSDENVKFIDLSRNFGQHSAIKAGLDNASGDYNVVMDCDLQDDPGNIKLMYEKAKEGNDIVIGFQKEYKISPLKKAFSNGAHKLMEIFMDFPVQKGVSSLSLLSKKVLTEIQNFNEQNFVYMPALFWLGYKTAYVEIIKEERAVGKSGYSFIKNIKLLFNLLISNSKSPLLMLTITCSFLMFLFSFLLIFKLIFDYIVRFQPLAGWTSLICSIFFVGGVISLCLTILSLYIGQIADGVRHRPLYVIKRKINL